MIKIRKKEKDYIKTYAEQFLAEYTPDMDWKSILIHAYLELMETDSLAQAELAAESILSQMEEFYACYDLNLMEPQDGDRIYLHHLIHELSLEKQCQTLHSLSEGLLALKQGSEPAPCPTEVSEELRDRLMEKTIALLQEKDTSPLTETGTSYQPLMNKISDDLFTAMTAMILYCMAKKGQSEDCPQNVTLQQVVTCVCLERAQEQTSFALQNDYIEAEQAQEQQQAAVKTGTILLLAAGVIGSIFAAIFLKSLPSVIDTIGGLTRAGKRIVPQAEDVLLEIAEENDLNLSKVSLTEPQEIPVYEGFVPQENKADLSIPINTEQDVTIRNTQKQKLQH